MSMKYVGPDGWVLNGKSIANGQTVELSRGAAQQMLANGHPLVAVDKDGPVPTQTGVSDVTLAAEAALAMQQQQEEVAANKK